MSELDNYFALSMKDMLNSGFVLDDNCTCFENECYYSGEPYSWMKKNIDKNQIIMMWWDFGRAVEAAGLTPLIEYPSKPTIDKVASCFNPKSFGCIELMKNNESDKKINDVSTFFTTENENKSLCVAYLYNASYIYVDSSMLNKYPVLAQISNSAIPRNSNESKSFFSKMWFSKGKKISFIELVHDYIGILSEEYMIFKINYPYNIDEICKYMLS